MPLDQFNFSEPQYSAVFAERARRLFKIRDGKVSLPAIKLYYKDHVADFINDWGVTFDPRNVGSNSRPAYLPFILFPRQREWIEWFLRRIAGEESGACEKSRDMGVSWLAVSVACSLCLFNDHMAVGFGSRKEEYVDKLGDPKSLFWKAREFIKNLPKEFRGGWEVDKHSPHMRIMFPETQAVISGESGDNIGRGDRTKVYIVDEASYIERPQNIEASLSATTNVRIDVSSANGSANPFYDKRTKWLNTDRLFTFHWRDDPRKDEAIKDKDGLSWYERQVRDLDAIVVAQEIDIDYSASVKGVLIPNAWVQAAVDAHKKLGWEIAGDKYAALDVSDEGDDKNAICGAHGPLIEAIEEWTGKGTDVYATVVRAFGFCDDHGYNTVVYDADGLGTNVRGDARVINKARPSRNIEVVPFRASDSVLHPEREDVPGRLNKDFFFRRKAQAWWELRLRFEKTWRAVTKGITAYAPSEMISLSSEITNLAQVCMELSQPTYTRNEAGQIVVDKKPEGAKSPNKADSVMMRMARRKDQVAGGFFSANDILDNAVAVPTPTACDTVFSIAHSSGKPGQDNDGTAVVEFAYDETTNLLTILDWDLTEVTGDVANDWLPAKFASLDRWASIAHPRYGSQGMLIEDKGPGVILIEQARRWGEVTELEGKITEVDALQQTINVSTYIKGGQVRITEAAMSKQTEYKGAVRNHLTGQILGFSADAKDTPQLPLLRAFVFGVAVALGDADGI